MTYIELNVQLLLMYLSILVLKTSAIFLNLPEVAKKNVKADAAVLEIISNVGFIMCAKRCADMPRCNGVNFYKPRLTCELLQVAPASVTSTRPAEGWWHVDNIEWLKHRNLAVEMGQNQCTSGEKRITLSSGSSNCVARTPKNCQDPLISRQGHGSGVFTISPQGNQTFGVYCDFETSQESWTVIQRRVDGTVSFDRPWVDYKTGFGNLRGNFWLGNDNIHSLLSVCTGSFTLRVDIEYLNGAKSFAEYSTFYVAGEDDKYRLTLQGHSGTAGYGLSLLSIHNNMLFSTKDSDNDHYIRNCARDNNGGWWYKKCYSTYTYLNGIYRNATHMPGYQVIYLSSFEAKNVCMKVKENQN